MSRCPFASTLEAAPIVSETVIIAGAGQAAGQAVASLRQEGFDGRIVLVGAEPVQPYQRPPLSKAFLAGTLPLERLFLKPPAFYEQARVETLLGVAVTELDAARRQVRWTMAANWRLIICCWRLAGVPVGLTARVPTIRACTICAPWLMLTAFVPLCVPGPGWC
jgi:Uncharacterized NAD(FAD)-dependent dehydrogenases